MLLSAEAGPNALTVRQRDSVPCTWRWGSVGPLHYLHASVVVATTMHCTANVRCTGGPTVRENGVGLGLFEGLTWPASRRFQIEWLGCLDCEMTNVTGGWAAATVLLAGRATAAGLLAHHAHMYRGEVACSGSEGGERRSDRQLRAPLQRRQLLCRVWPRGGIAPCLHRRASRPCAAAVHVIC